MLHIRLLIASFALMLALSAWAEGGVAYVIGPVTYIPFSVLMPVFGMNSQFDATTQVLTVRLQDNRVVTLKAGNSAVTVAGKAVPLEAKILDIQGATYVPVGAFTTALSVSVTPADGFLNIGGSGGRVMDIKQPLKLVPVTMTPAELALRQKPMQKALGKALMNAVVQNDTATAAKLLKANPELNYVWNRDKNLPIHVACRAGLKAMVETLLANGASLEARGNIGGTALHQALTPDIMRWGDVPGACDPDALPWEAAQKIERLRVPSDEMAAFLLAKGAAANARNADGATPLHIAAGKDWWLAELLLNNGADSGARDIGGHTALHVAAAAGCIEVADLLLEKGLSVKSRDNAGDTPLHAAASYFRTGMMIYLLDKGAEVDAVDDTGNTPFSDAARTNSFLFRTPLAVLLAKGANINTTDKWGQSPLALCALQPSDTQLQLARFLLEHGAKTDGMVPFFACESGNPALVTLLLDNGMDVNVRDKDGRTPIYWAILNQRVEAVKLLLTRKADLTVADRTGQTPLACAKEASNQAIIKLLTDAGAK